MPRVYPAHKMIAPDRFQPLLLWGMTPGKKVIPAPDHPGHCWVGVPPGIRKVYKWRHTRRSRRWLARDLAVRTGEISGLGLRFDRSLGVEGGSDRGSSGSGIHARTKSHRQQDPGRL